jgi:hypothetical protein
VSFLSTLKKVGRAIDPTSKTSPLGGLVAGAISIVPGGAAVLGGVQAVNAVKPAPKPAPVPVPITTKLTAPGSVLGWFGTTTGTAVGLAVAGLLAVWLMVRRK